MSAEDYAGPYQDSRCGVKHDGYPFSCQLPPRHSGPHEDWSVSVGGDPWTWETEGRERNER